MTGCSGTMGFAWLLIEGLILFFDFTSERVRRTGRFSAIAPHRINRFSGGSLGASDIL